MCRFVGRLEGWGKRQTRNSIREPVGDSMNAMTGKVHNDPGLVGGDYEWENRGVFGDSEYSSKGQLSSFVKEESAGGWPDVIGQSSSRPRLIRESWEEQVQKTIRRTCQHYLDTQHPEGYWWAELESNVTITAEYVMLLHLLEIRQPEKLQSMVKYLLNQQGANGAWGLYFGDEGNLSTTIEAYFALKLAGEDPQSEPLRKARDFILRHGGMEEARVFTKIWLALFSQYDWDNVPSMPVELVLLPPHFYFNIYEFSSWARGTVVPLSIVLALRPHYPLPAELGIAELYLEKPEHRTSRRFASITHKLFYLFDRVAKAFERRPLPSLRNKAVHTAETWILEHQEESGDWGGIQPPMVYSILALHYLGYPLDEPVIVKGLKALEDFCIQDQDGLRMQSCVSPVWDTALSALALRDAGVSPNHPVVRKAVSWLLKKQILSGGDWQVKNCCPPGGWAFEFVNNQYPDVDDSAVVLNTLHHLSDCACEGMDCARDRGMEWCLSMQCCDGGWAAFDKDNQLVILNRIPFADHEAMVDYPTADVTGRMLEAMGNYGYDRNHRRAQKAIQFIKNLQESDGAWWGRWGVNYIYGTWSVLRGLISIGEDPQAPYIQKAVQWIKAHQNADGGWGETCESYMNAGLRGQGPSTASQTAWALMSLFATGETSCSEVRKGVQYLMQTQKPDGTWEELYFTGTGFPGHFFIRYHNYRNCFPLMALGQYQQRMGGGNGTGK